MNAVISSAIFLPRSLVEERRMRPPTIGKIRPGIKILKSSARNNPQAARLYQEMVDAGENFDTIAKVIESKCKLRDALVPKNVPYFTCRRADFINGDVADEILRLYGEDRGEGRKLYRFPMLFAFNDWMRNLPNEMAAWSTSGRKFFSEYGSDGVRYCKTYAKPETHPQAQRVRRHFGGRMTIFRQDAAIPDGVCDPEQCPQYQSRQCNLSASFLFAVPEIRGLGLIELPTNSIYVLQKAYAAMQTVMLARGRLSGTTFWLSKREFDITRINENGESVRQKQLLTVLDADIDMGALLDAADHPIPELEVAGEAAAPMETAAPAGAFDSVATPAIVEPLPPAEEGSNAKAPGAGASSSEPRAVAPENESLEDKRHRLADLLARLGLSTPARQQAFRVYAHSTYGRKWTERAADLDLVNQSLTEALDDPAAFLATIEKVGLEVLTD